MEIRSFCVLALAFTVLGCGAMDGKSSWNTYVESDSVADHSAETLANGKRTLLLDTVQQRRDCEFNLLTRIAAIHDCTQCLKTRMRMEMASRALTRLANQHKDTTRGVEYLAAVEYISRLCPRSSKSEEARISSSQSETSNHDAAAKEELTTMENMVNAIPLSSWKAIAQADQGTDQEMAALSEKTMVDLLFPSLHEACCLSENGCSHDYIAQQCD